MTRQRVPQFCVTTLVALRRPLRVRDTLLHETLGLVAQGGVIGIGPDEVKPTLQANQDTVAFQAHSDYSASIAERGPARWCRPSAADSGDRVPRAQDARPAPSGVVAIVRHPGALVGALVAFAIAANIYELLHFRYVWTMLAIVGGCEHPAVEARHMKLAAARQALIRDSGSRLVLSNFGARIGALLAVG